MGVMTPAEVVSELLLADDAERQRAVLRRALEAGAPEPLLCHLKAESERYWTADPHRSLRLAEALILGAELARQPRHLSLGLMAKADALRYLGCYPDSLELFEAAGRAFLEQGDEVGWARTRIGWVFSCQYLGRGAEALAVIPRARDILVRHGEWLRAAGLELNTAVVYYELGRYDQALALYDRAIEFFERARQNDPTLSTAAEIRAAKARANKALILTLLGEFGTALALHREAREVFVRHGDTVSVLRQDHYLADVYAAQGDYTRALRQYDDTRAALERAGLEVDAAWVALNMAECYLSLNRHQEALELAEQATACFARLGSPTEAAKARLGCALACARLGEVERALRLLDEVGEALTRAGLSGETLARVGFTGQAGSVALLRAGLYLGAGDWPAALREAERAWALLAERGLAVRQAQAELLRAWALLELGQAEEAADLARSALAAGQESGAPWLVHDGQHLLARVAAATGDLAAALDGCERAIASIERVQSRLASELRSHFLEDKLRIYHDAIVWSLRLEAPERAFEYLERAKSRALVDYLAQHPEVRLAHGRAPGDRELAAELARLRAEHNWFYQRLYGQSFARRPDDGSEALSDTEAARLREAIYERERRITQLLERLALRQGEAVDAASPASGEQRPRIDERTVVLEYYLRDDLAAMFLLSSRGIAAVPLAARPAELRRLLRLWQLNLDATARALAAGAPLDGLARNARGVLQGLYRALVMPVAEQLAAYERLVVVPYGETHRVPFHALHDGQRFLVERLEVSACPSSRLLRLCQERPVRAGSALVLAHSGGGRLPWVLEEARLVSRLLPGRCYLEEAATREALVEAAPSAAVVHLAAHGEARLDNPTFAHLALADGQLSAADVFNLELDGALVTLSACETGRSVVAGGDELIGLSRGFLHAGAATLVQSLWRADDGSTAALMAHFYRALRGGAPRGAALREAQRALLDERRGHPFFWAAFQLVGASETPVAVAEQPLAVAAARG